eukprot:Trichotokara_eunicae@DN5784_c0_g1_i1.p1
MGRSRLENSIKGRLNHLKTYPRDVDQVIEDIDKQRKIDLKGSKDVLPQLEVDEEQIGRGQFYCIICARHFLDQEVLEKHMKTKKHKSRIKEVRNYVPHDPERPVF